jgi:hypothetical protein
MPNLAHLRYPIFPQLQEALFAVVLLFADDVTTHLLALLATLLTAALLVGWGRRRFSPGAGWIAAAVYGGSPIVVYLAATAYIEPALVLYATAALYSVDRWQEEGEGQGGSRWLVLAVLFAGSAADCKYLGLFFLAVVGIAAVATGATGATGAMGATRRRLGRGAWVGGLGLLVIAPTYGRITAATGNPIFPYLPEVFGASPWVAHEFHSLGGLGARFGEVLATLLRASWDVIFARARLGGYPPYSPLVVLGLPAVLVLAWSDRRIRWMLAVVAAYGFAVCALLPDARYLLAGLPLLCLGVGEALAWVGNALLRVWREGRGRRGTGGREPVARATAAAVAGLLAVGCFLPGWAYAGYRIHLQGALPTTAAERDVYLGRALPAYAAVRYLDGLRGPSNTLYAVHAENLAYFAGGRFLGDWSGPAGYGRIVPADGDASLLYRRLRALGVGHLLLVEHDATLASLSASPAFGRLFLPLYSDGRARIYGLRAAAAAVVMSPRGDD